MKYFEIIKEAITNIPIQKKLFWSNRVKELRDLLKVNSVPYFEVINNRDYWYMLDKIEQDCGGVDIKYSFKRIVDDVELLISNIDAYLKFGQNFYTYLRYPTANLVEKTNDVVNNSINFENINDILENNFGSDENDSDYIKAKQAVESFISIFNFYKRINLISNRILKVLDETDNRSNYAHNIEKYRPKHDDIETLYHVSIHCGYIIKNGFQDVKPEEFRGVGNFGNQELISFTHNLVIAQTILRAFREIWMIVHGQLDLSTIFSWAEKDGVDKNDLVKMYGGNFKNIMKEKLKDIDFVLNIYRYYLALSKTRMDPVIVNLDELGKVMKTIEYKEIGIVECEVELNDNETYHYGEYEFRVKPSQILSVKRYI